MKKNYGKIRPSPEPGDILTLKQRAEYAEYLKCHPSSLYRVKDGRVSYFRVGGVYRFQRSTIDNWIKKKTQVRS